VTAASDLQKAQGAVATAKAELDALNTRIADGDVTVTGAALVSTEAAVTLAGRIVTGAEARAAAEVAAEQAAAAEVALEKLKTEYTSGAATLSNAVAAAVTGIQSLAAAAQTFQASAGAAHAAVMSHGPDAVGHDRYRRLQMGTLDGFGSVQAPKPSAIAKGLEVFIRNALAGRPNVLPTTVHNGSMHTLEGDPALQAIGPFLPAELEKVN
jgi:hypothetical protein